MKRFPGFRWENTKTASLFPVILRMRIFHPVFIGTNLERSDFRTVANFSIDPEANRIRKAKFPMSGLPRLLGKYGLEIDFGS